jgi:hypothetical protein
MANQAINTASEPGQPCHRYQVDHDVNHDAAAVSAPRTIEEDSFLIDQDTAPTNDIPLDNSLTDNYAALRRFIKGNTEFLGSHSLLELVGGLGASLSCGREAYKQGVREGWSAYWVACKSWIPSSAENRKQGFQNPVRLSWGAFLRGMSETEKPDVELFKPMQRALTLHGALIGGRGKAVDIRRNSLSDTVRNPLRDDDDDEDEADIVLESMQFLEDVGKLLQLQ